ncbi:hypothetical protein ATJ97_1387 [Georgenia soli]|uniref:Uncharacterized protein n=1 Tax=Georgenia soli TaxID=638953 RepID=A0A2A9EIJ0_9MICO|nr:hypothetical protein [Georgenia soli]PFG38897.1 hypothetical protein ATJ97_1387 [Georgenia soli]
MSTGWVAGAVRAKALARRRLGAAGARELAGHPNLAAAVRTLARGPYGHDVRPGQSLAEAQHAAGAALLWNARVLAGWLPREGAETVRVLMAGFEVANVDAHLAAVAGVPGASRAADRPVGAASGAAASSDAASASAAPAYDLGTLDTAGQRAARTTTLAGAAEVLAASPWRVRAPATRRALALGLRIAWADAVVSAAPDAAGWARTGAVLVLAREVLAEGRSLPPSLLPRTRQLLGAGPAEAIADGAPVPGLRARLPQEERWVLEGVDEVDDLWRAEVRWWHRLEDDGFALLRDSRHGPRPVVGALAVLAADLWRVRAALETAARGGTGWALEAFDAVA